MNTASLVLFLAAATFVPQEPGSGRAPDARRAGEELRVYEVGDILTQLGPDYPAPKLGVVENRVPNESSEAAMKRAAAPEPTPAELEARSAANAALLVDILRRDMQPPLPAKADALRCVATGALMANLTPEQHAWTGSFLQRLRKFDGIVEVEVRVIEGPAGVMQEWGIAPNSVLTNTAALTALEERIKQSSRFDLLVAPRLMVLPLQRASLSTLNDVSFVRDWSVEIVEPDQREIAVPLIGVIHEGLAVDVRAIPIQVDEIRLDLELQQCEVKRPIRTASVPLGRDKHPVEIGLPEAEVSRQKTSLALKSGTSIVLISPMMGKSTEQVLIVSARRVPRNQR
jgi:hypothetical protein